MDFLELFGIVFVFSAIKEFADSMRRSKTLTIMVIVGVTFFAAFTFFLIKMAGNQ